MTFGSNLSRSSFAKECTEELTTRHASRTTSWVVNGTPTQVKLHSYGKAQSDECQLCRKKGNELLRFFQFQVCGMCAMTWKTQYESMKQFRLLKQPAKHGCGRERCVTAFREDQHIQEVEVEVIDIGSLKNLSNGVNSFSKQRPT